jgi:signal transduction histidine kinase
MKFTFKSRLSLYITVTTTLTILVLFVIIYSVVEKTVYNHLDEDLKSESAEVKKNLLVLETGVLFANFYEWFESEHGPIGANPTYLQLIDENGLVLLKTPNLNNEVILYDSAISKENIYNTYISDKKVRQIQVPLTRNDGKSAGFVLIAMPITEYVIVLKNLQTVLIVAFPVTILIMLFVSKFTAGRGIKPINKIINTAESITNDNLSKRIDYPVHKDELYLLVDTINKLLNRLQEGITRERQFISDASHELRTPLSVIKGNLEVLIRKHREPHEYEESVKYCINEVDRISSLVDQLLMLAKYENDLIKPEFGEVGIEEIIPNVLKRVSTLIKVNNTDVVSDFKNTNNIKGDRNILSCILENVISNAVKYSGKNGKVSISTKRINGYVECEIKDNGEGIRPEMISKIFDPFYRVEESRNSEIPGYGLGLSIVKKLAEIHRIGIVVTSNESGTTFKLNIPVFQ